MEQITIIGGGLSGSLLAIFMAKRGYKVDVYERRPDPRRSNVYQGKSINLALSNRGLRALEKVGMDTVVLEQAIPMGGRMVHSKTGELSFQPYGKEGQAINSVSRGGLNIQLLKLASDFENISLHFDHKCTDVDPEKGIAEFETPSGARKLVTCGRIIGTDGAFAATRLHMQLSQRFDYSQDFEDYGYKELHIPSLPDGGFALDKNCLHIWPRGNFMMIALPNPDGSFTCTLFYPHQGPHSFESIDTEDKMLAFFRENFADAMPFLTHLSDDFFGNPTGSLVTVRCYPWVYKDKMALLGDAAHAIVPFYGQGMNCAFEDCVILDECMDKYPDNWKAIFENYQLLRKPNADAIAHLALQNFVEMRDKVGQPEFQHRKQVEHALTEYYGDVFKSQYELVTFSNVPYSTALKQGETNDRILDELIAGNIAVTPGNEAVKSILQKYIQ